MNPNNIHSLCRHALNDLGPKFNTHLGQSCGTVPSHLCGIDVPGGMEKKIKGSSLNIHEDRETTVGNPTWTTGLRVPKVQPDSPCGNSSWPLKLVGGQDPKGEWKIQGQAKPEARLRGGSALTSLEPCPFQL